jgi:hypothetical protein
MPKSGSTHRSLLEAVMKKTDTQKVKLPTPAIKDSHKVRIGGYAPTLPVRSPSLAIADSGRVRIGGYAFTI